MQILTHLYNNSKYQSPSKAPLLHNTDTLPMMTEKIVKMLTTQLLNKIHSEMYCKQGCGNFSSHPITTHLKMGGQGTCFSALRS